MTDRPNMKNKYHRITPAELSDDLRELGLTAGQFAKIAGSQRQRVLEWIGGREDIPAVVGMLIELLHVPGAIEVAAETVKDMLIEAEEGGE